MTDYSQEPEESLVRRAIQQDKAAFAGLYDKYVDKVYRHVYYRTFTKADADDITQEVFIKAWKAIAKFKQTGSPFGAWLIAIARNAIADHYKVKKKTVSLENIEIASRNPEANPEAMIEISLNNDRIKTAVLKLKGDKRKIILLRLLEGWRYREISGLLNKSEGAIRVMQFRALVELRQILQHGEKNR